MIGGIKIRKKLLKVFHLRTDKSKTLGRADNPGRKDNNMSAIKNAIMEKMSKFDDRMDELTAEYEKACLEASYLDEVEAREEAAFAENLFYMGVQVLVDDVMDAFDDDDEAIEAMELMGWRDTLDFLGI